MRKLTLALLATLLLLAVPTSVAAAPPTSFTATASVWVTGAVDYDPAGPRLRTLGEGVEGPIVLSDWAAIQGGYFTSLHDSNVAIDAEGNVSGTMHGTFTFTTAGGTLQGTFNGKVSGNLFTGIVDEGHWTATKGSGALQDVQARGTWSGVLNLVEVAPGVFTLVGALTFKGTYN